MNVFFFVNGLSIRKKRRHTKMKSNLLSLWIFKTFDLIAFLCSRRSLELNFFHCNVLKITKKICYLDLR